MENSSPSELVLVSDEAAVRRVGIPLKSSTLKKYYYNKKIPSLFVKIGVHLYIDLNVWRCIQNDAVAMREHSFYTNNPDEAYNTAEEVIINEINRITL